MPPSLANITRPDGEQNTPGLKIFHRFALYSEITTLPEPSASASFADVVTVSGDIVFATGKQFWKIEGILNKNSLDSKGSEQLDAAGVDNTFKLFLPNNKTSLGFLETHKNSNLVFLVEDIDGNQRLLGQPGLPARIAPYDSKSGAAQSDEKVIEVTIMNVGKVARFYTGAIQDTPAA